jgi:hypothetical protein
MKWVLEPSATHVLEVADNLRDADVLEVMLSHRMSAHEAVRESWAQSDIIRGMVTDAGIPCGLCGVVGQRIWMLGTDDLTRTRKARWQLCVEGRKWVDSCLKELGGPLFNQVYSKNTESIRWLKYLGFTVDSPRPIGPSAALFCDFWRDN